MKIAAVDFILCSLIKSCEEIGEHSDWQNYLISA